MAQTSTSVKNNNFSGPSEEIDYEPLNFDIEELDDEEFQIPTVSEPSLESILNETDDGLSFNEDIDRISSANLLDLGPETQSVSSRRSRSGDRRNQICGAEVASETLSVGSQSSVSGDRRKQKASTGLLRHVLLKGISVQLTSAAERTDAGNATVVAIGSLLALGTSRGVILVFDVRQALRWVLRSPDKDHGSVSSLSFNIDSTRLLVGFARGLIMMFDVTNGNTLRTLTDVHPPNTAVLAVKFTDLPNLALCSDSGGSVFELSFTRTLGVRGCDTRCVFSGSRGEVTTMEPLLLRGLKHPLENSVITAMATLTKIIVVCIKPKIRVILVRPLAGGPTALPLLAWHLVMVQSNSSKTLDPVLACAKSDTISFYQVSVNRGGKLLVSALQKLTVSYSLLSMHWLNSWTIAVLDNSERLHLIDVHSHEELESSDLSSVGLVYESSHFKGIFTGGNVSKAMARAGEKACYNTVVSHGGQLLILGGKSLHVLTIRQWNDRLTHLASQRKYMAAMALAISFYEDPKSVTGIRRDRRAEAVRFYAIRILQKFTVDMTHPDEDIPAIVQYSVNLNSTDVIFATLWDTVLVDQRLKNIFLSALEPFILNDQLQNIPPAIVQQFVICYEQAGKFQALEACILHLEISSMDLHMIMQVCKTHELFDAIIYVQNHAFLDYIAPIQDLLSILQKAIQTGKELTGKEVELGNKMLVYISYCLAGRGYPTGDVPKDMVQKVKHDVFSTLISIHTKDGGDDELSYPYLRTLLHFDTREFLNVVSLAFTEPEFTTELGLTQRQRLVDILLQIMLSPGFSASEIGTLFTFLARQLSRPASGLQIPAEKFHPVFEFLTEMNPAHKEERQQTLLELLRAAGLQGYPKDELLQRAKNAGFFRVCEVIYEQCGQWDQVFQCYLDDPRRRPHVFSFLRNIFLLSRNPSDVVVLMEAVEKNVEELLALDENLTGNLLATNLMHRLPYILDNLNDESRLKVLRSTLYNRTQIEENGKELYIECFPQYVELCSRLDPESTVPALEKHSNILDDEVVLDIVRACQQVDAEAFILQKLGRFDEAFDVVNDSIRVSLANGEKCEKLINTAVGLLQRKETDELWLKLLDTLIIEKMMSSEEKTKMLQMVLTGATGYSNPSTVLNFLLKHPAYSGATFGDLMPLFTGMLENSRYEATLAATTLKLVHHDLHSQLSTALRVAKRAVRPTADSCSVCGGSFLKSSAVIFPCGHPIHEACFSSSQCPVCAVLTLDRAVTRKLQKSVPKEHGSPKSFLKLQVAARPVLDLKRLS